MTIGIFVSLIIARIYLTRALSGVQWKYSFGPIGGNRKRQRVTLANLPHVDFLEPGCEIAPVTTSRNV